MFALWTIVSGSYRSTYHFPLRPNVTDICYLGTVVKLLYLVYRLVT